jgi:tRNA U38,U39,U40 pseudouridine synthase TruA
MKYCGVVSYSGAAYKGFERQKDYPTIQGKLEDALSAICGILPLFMGLGEPMRA